MRKQTMAVVLAVLASTQTHAEEMSTLEMCTKVAEAAETIMKARQIGVPMHKAWEIWEPTGDIGKRMVKAAYDEPKYTLDEFQNRAISEFKDDYFGACVKAYSK